MTISEIKKRIIAYRDFYGGDISDTDAIENAKTKKELAAILEKHRHLLEDMLSDAHSHLDSFKTKLGLTIL